MEEWNPYSLVLLSRKLTGRLEIDAEVRIITFVVFADIFDGVDMEGDCEPLHREDDRLSFAINEYLCIVST